MKRWLPLVLATLPTLARAQTDAPQAAPTVAQPTLTPQSTLTWPVRYEQARQFLRDGEFEKAAAALDELIPIAPSPEDARAARELSELARYWQKRDLAFVPRQSLGESTLAAKAVDRRTVDEVVSLYITAAAYGTGLGISLAVLGDATSPAAFILPAIAGAGLGIGGVAVADTFGRLRYGQPQSISSGVFLGLAGGVLFDAWHASNTSSSSAQWDAKAYVGLGVAATTLGGVVGGALGSLLPVTPGRASWVGSGGLWGFGLVLSVTGAIAGQNIKEGVLIAGMMGYGAGIVGAALTAGIVSPSIARVRLLDLGGLVGGATAFGLYFAALNGKDADPNVGLGLLGLGIATGLTTTWLLTMKMQPDRPNEVKETVSFHPILAPLPGGGTAGLAGTF